MQARAAEHSHETPEEVHGTLTGLSLLHAAQCSIEKLLQVDKLFPSC